MPASLTPLPASLIGRLLHVDAVLARRASGPTAYAAGDLCPPFGNGYHHGPWLGQGPPAHCPLLSFAIAPSGSQASFARQAEAECRSPILCTLGHKVTTLGPRELSGDGESETRTGAFAAGAGCLRPVEAVENTG
jgi:hypothetical protein